MSLTLVSDMVPFKQSPCLYRSSPLFSAHSNFFFFLSSYFFAIKYDYNGFWRESSLTDTFILRILWSLSKNDPSQ